MYGHKDQIRVPATGHTNTHTHTIRVHEKSASPKNNRRTKFPLALSVCLFVLFFCSRCWFSLSFSCALRLFGFFISRVSCRVNNNDFDGFHYKSKQGTEWIHNFCCCWMGWCAWAGVCWCWYVFVRGQSAEAAMNNAMQTICISVRLHPRCTLAQAQMHFSAGPYFFFFLLYGVKDHFQLTYAPTFWCRWQIVFDAINQGAMEQWDNCADGDMKD